jgi:hypothetical protein
MGVTQQRMAQIEARPEVATFDTIARLVAVLEGRLLVDDMPGGATPVRDRKPSGSSRRKEKSDPGEDW